MELETSPSCEVLDFSGAVSPRVTGRLEAIAGAIHFIGIGGIGMSALARLLLAKGRIVSGSDKSETPITKELQSLGARIFIGHDQSNVKDAGAVVISTAITRDNAERAAAERAGLPLFHRSEVLAWLAENARTIGVSGTHGKTTTTGMIAQLFIDGGLDPSVVVGGIFPRLNSNARVGNGKYFIAEADESDRTHAGMPSHMSVVTNIEPDHLENYPGGMNQILSTMAEFVNKSERAVICIDDEGCRRLLKLISVPVTTYGVKDISPDADYTLEVLENGDFRVFKSGREAGLVRLQVPGLHNRLNALCAIAVGFENGLTFQCMRTSLESFGGVERRFQILGNASGITVVDDYGHHPTEVRATLQAARQFLQQTNSRGRVVAIFQPHQPGRLRDLWHDFCQSFRLADLVLLSDVYVARGEQIEGINSERFAREVDHRQAVYLPGAVKDLPARILPHLRSGDIVLTIGAGDITSIGRPLLSLIESSMENASSRE